MTGTIHHIGAQPYTLEMCPTCGTLYLFPQAIKDAALRVRDKQRKENRAIYCPEGHSWNYTRQAEEEIAKRDTKYTQQLADKVEELKAKLEASEALVRSLGGNVTALPIRATNK